jgi:hypothetical protein
MVYQLDLTSGTVSGYRSGSLRAGNASGSFKAGNASGSGLEI